MKPIFVTPAIPQNKDLYFFLQREQIKIDQEDACSVMNLYRYADGRRTIEEISELAKIPLNKVQEVISELQNLKIVTELSDDSAISFNESDFNDCPKKIALINELMGKDKPVKRAWLEPIRKNDFFFAAISVYYDGYKQIQYAGSTSTSPLDALFKAIIEGYERWQSGQIRVDYYGKALELSNWLNPNNIYPMVYNQIKKQGLTEFRKNLDINWTLGKDSNNEDILIPSDIIYYGHQVLKNRIFFGNSSGIAAFTDTEEAKKRAITELVERDAIMQNWFVRTSPNKINRKKLPRDIQSRITYWSEQNVETYILELPSKYGCVIEIIFVSDYYPYFVSGAAATIEISKINNALHKAFDEAEFNMRFAQKTDPIYAKIPLKRVVFPVDHGNFYHQKKHMKTLKWLWSGKTIEHFSKFDEKSIEELIKELEIVIVDMSATNSSIKVVRAICEKLIPITFGTNNAPYIHPALRGFSMKSLKFPHYFS